MAGRDLPYGLSFPYGRVIPTVKSRPRPAPPPATSRGNGHPCPGSSDLAGGGGVSGAGSAQTVVPVLSATTSSAPSQPQISLSPPGLAWASIGAPTTSPSTTIAIRGCSSSAAREVSS